MNARKVGLAALVISGLLHLCASAAERPELSAYPFRSNVAAGTYEAVTAGTNFVISGSLDGDVVVIATELCRVTLSDAAMSGVLAITGDAQLWLEGDNSITTDGASAITCTGTLTVGGPGSLRASACGGKKTGVIAGVDLILAGGSTVLTIDAPNVKNACGVSLSGNYTQLAGTLKIVGESDDCKQNGIFLSKKKAKALISGGILDIALAGEKSVGLAMDKDLAACEMSGGVVRLVMTGDGAKGIKGDGVFSMTGGAIDATMTGGYVEDLLEYEDSLGNVWNYYVTLSSSSTTSGNSDQGSDSLVVATSAIINNGTYAVYDPSKAYAVKVGDLSISGGLVRIRCTGACGRGLGADNMYLSGGVYDISVEGGPTDVYVASLVEADDLDDTTATNGTVAVCLDSGSAACLKTSGDAGVMQITGGVFELKATGNAGKLISAAGSLVIGEEDAATLPTDRSFLPDIQGQTFGQKVFCACRKQKYYGSLAMAMATTDISAVSCATASENVVAGSSSDPGAADEYDYSNSKGVKGEGGVAFNSGRLRIYTANDGGEGLESKSDMTINGGVLELNCADDCINTAGNLTINGGYVYAASRGNDAIDSNADVTINDGWIYAFTLTSPEEAIDVNSGHSVTINGGCIFGVGAARSGREGTIAGTQGYYQGSKTLSTSATYWQAAGTHTIYGRIPAAASSTRAYLFCSVPGMTNGSAPTSYGTSAPASARSVGFHGYYTTDGYDGGSGGESGDSGDALSSGNWTTDGTLSYTYTVSAAHSKSFTYAASYIAGEAASYVLSNATITASESNKIGLLAANGAQVTLVNCTIVKSGDGSGQSNDDNYNFYGINNAVVALGSSTRVTLDNCTVTTSAKYANAVFASDAATINVTNGIAITTTGNSARGLFASYAGTVQAPDGGVRIATAGKHCAGLATDRGGGTIICGSSPAANPSYVNTTANDSPCIYSTGTVRGCNVTGVCTNGQAVVIEGKNTVNLLGCDMTGGRSDQGCIFLYQSGSGDASDSDAVGNYSTFLATNCTFTARNSADMYVVSHTVSHVNTAGCTYRNTNGADYTASADLGSGDEMFIKCYEIQWGTGNYLTFTTTDSLVGTVYTGDSTSRATVTHGGSGLAVSSGNVGTVTVNGVSY